MKATNTKNVPKKYQTVNLTLSKKLVAIIPRGIVSDIPSCVNNGPSRTTLFAHQKSEIHVPTTALSVKNPSVEALGHPNSSIPVKWNIGNNGSNINIFQAPI